MTLKTPQEMYRNSYELITRDGSSSDVATIGIDMNAGEEAIMEEVWACGAPCSVNKYDEDQDLTHFAAMNAVQLRDHLRNYHMEKGDTLFMPWVRQFFEIVKALEAGRNQTRKAKEEKETNELAKIKKEFGYA